VEIMQALLRDQATTWRTVYQVHPSWAVGGGLKGVALCCWSQEHGRRVDRSPFGEVWYQSALLCPEGILKSHGD